MESAPLDHAAIIDRMKLVLGVETDGQLARSLGITRGAVSHWRKGQKIPMDRVADVGNRASANLGWLLRGTDEMRPPPYRPGHREPYFDRVDALDWGVMEIAVRQIELQIRATGVRKSIDPELPENSNLFIHIKLLYTKYLDVFRALLDEGMSREQALKALRLVADLSHERNRPKLELMSKVNNPRLSGEKE